MEAGREPLPPWRLLAAFAVLAALAVLLANRVLAAFEQRQRQAEFEQLSAVVQLKAERIENWLAERRLAVETLMSSPSLRQETWRYLARPDPVAGTRLREQIQARRTLEDAIGVELIDAQGRPLLVVGRRLSDDGVPDTRLPSRSAVPRAVLVDLHRNRPDGPIHLALEVAVPEEAGSPPVPAAYFRFAFDPEGALYPLLRSWPLSSVSGEILLLRREGEHMLALSELRHLENGILDARLPAPSFGQSAYHGQDYRGTPVLAATRPVAGTPWILVAKEDEAEVLGDFYNLRRLGIALVLAALACGGLLLWQAWQRQARRGRQALAAQLEDLAAIVPGALYSFRLATDGKASFPYASPAMEALCGLPAGQLAVDAGCLHARVHPDDQGHLQEGLAESARRLSAWHGQFRLLHPAKGEIRVEGRSAPGRELGGGTVWHGFMQDISERHGAEQSLRQADGRWRRLAEAMPQPLWSCNVKGECQFVNRYWAEYTGHPAAAQSGHAWLQAFHPEDAPRLAAALARAAADQTSFDDEFRLRRSDGRYRWFKTQAIPWRDKPGEAPTWYGFNTDIQEMKEVEAALQRSLLRQQGLQQLDRAVLEASTPEEVAAKGLEHLATLLPCWCSTAVAVDLEAGKATILALRHVLAFAPDQCMSLASYGFLDVADLARGQISVVADLAAQAERSAVLESLYRQGMRSYVRLPLMVEGRLMGALGLGSDQAGYFGPSEVEIARPIADVLAIALQQALLRQRLLLQTATLETRVAERTAELERMKDQAEAASLAKSQFLANMSHQLRTPLNSLLILSELLADNAQGNLSPEQTEFARVIHHAGNDLLALVNDILDIAKIESGRSAVHNSELSFQEILGYVDRLFRKAAESKGLRLELEVAADLPAGLHTDFHHLKPILRNLVANAVKFTSAGTIRLKVEPASAGWRPGHPALSRAPAAVAFQVADTGVGIAAEKLALIFDAFEPGNPGTPRRFGGTGLGLHIARANARILGGDLTVHSAPHRGSTFTLYLPLAHAAPHSDGARCGSA